MDSTVTGAVPHFRDSTGSQVIQNRHGPRWPVRNSGLNLMAKQDQTTTQRANRKTLTIAVLVLVALAFYVASFFVVSD